MKLATLTLAVGPHLVGLALLVAHDPAPHETKGVTLPRDEYRASRIDELPARPSTQKNAKPARTLTMRLEHGEAVPEGRPNTWVHIPATRDASADLRLTFIFHGFKNCIESYTSAGIQCSAANIKRPGYQIAAQLEAAGSHSIVVIPETSFDIYSGEAPTLTKPGAFRAYVLELLDAISDETGGAHLDDVRRFALAASSGGYQTLEPVLADIAPLVTDVLLMDAAYMYPDSAVGRFLAVATTELGTTPTPRHRIGILYTPSGGALPMSEEFLRITDRRLEMFGVSGRAHLGKVKGDPSLEDLSAPLYILWVHADHDVVVRRNLGRVMASAGL